MPASHKENLVAGKLLAQPMEMLGKERSVSSGKLSFQDLAKMCMFSLSQATLGKVEILLLVSCLEGSLLE